MGVFPTMGQSVSTDDCVDGHMDYSCDCISGLQVEVVNGERVCGNIVTVDLMHAEMATVSTR